MQKTLLGREREFANPARQRTRLTELGIQPFEERLAAEGLSPLRPTGLETLQVNVGRRCNQVCEHCHVDAGPDRKEVMSDQVLEACIALLETGQFNTLDITGGAPELHPRFAELVERGAGTGAQVIHRCNLTAIRLPAYSHLPALMAHHGVQIIASLPALAPACTDSQRGDGVFDESIDSLRELNELGYARAGTGLTLDLVSNPIGAALPASQDSLENEYRERLLAEHGVEFDRLLTITNMPISRFLDWLDEKGKLPGYMQELVDTFNGCAASGVMCRSLISVGPDGRLFDCDFNQMLEIGCEAPSILDLPPAGLIDRLNGRTIRTGEHCYGCTAGAGSGCQGATV